MGKSFPEEGVWKLANMVVRGVTEHALTVEDATAGLFENFDSYVAFLALDPPIERIVRARLQELSAAVQEEVQKRLRWVELDV